MARISIPPHPESVPVEIVLGYDEEGMIQVAVDDVATEVRLGDFEIDRQANLDAREVERMRAALRSLTGR